MRELGKSGLKVAGPLVFGGNVFGWTVDEARLTLDGEAVGVLDRASEWKK